MVLQSSVLWSKPVGQPVGTEDHEHEGCQHHVLWVCAFLHVEIKKTAIVIACGPSNYSSITLRAMISIILLCCITVTYEYIIILAQHLYVASD